MALEDAIQTKSKGAVLGQWPDKQVVLDTVTLQGRESLSFSDMISIAILGNQS